MNAMDERTATRSRTRAGLSRLAGPWWMFLLTGIAWLILSWVALRFTPASVPTVGALLGVLFLVAMINEFFIAAVLPSWRESLPPAAQTASDQNVLREDLPRPSRTSRLQSRVKMR